MNPSEIIKIDN